MQKPVRSFICISEKQKISGMTFYNVRIMANDVKFQACTFIHCTIEGIFSAEYCIFHGGTEQ